MSYETVKKRILIMRNVANPTPRGFLYTHHSLKRAIKTLTNIPIVIQTPTNVVNSHFLVKEENVVNVVKRLFLYGNALWGEVDVDFTLPSYICGGEFELRTDVNSPVHRKGVIHTVGTIIAIDIILPENRK